MSAQPLGEARCREILEVGPEAPIDEIRRAHAFLKGLYGPGAVDAGLPSMDEFSPAAQARVLEEIETAYRELSALHETQTAPAPVARPKPQEPGRALDGAGLRQAREVAGATLEHMAADTSVRLVYLEALEEERFKDLPSAQVIVRGYLSAYLSALGMDPEATLTDYLGRFQRWQGKSLR